jgi:hypothetical protein
VYLKLISLALKEEHGLKVKSVVLCPVNMKITVFYSVDGDISFLLNGGKFPPHYTALLYGRQQSSEVEGV